MAKFKYNIYYKDAQTGQDLASPVTVEYDTFNTAISATQKQFQGYTQRELWENQKKTPSEDDYNRRPYVQSYNYLLRKYYNDLAVAQRNVERVDSLKRSPNYYEYGSISVMEEYSTYSSGYDYFNPVKVFTNDQEAELLARPITYRGNREYNYSGKNGAPRMYRGLTFELTDVSYTLSGKTLNLLIRINDYDIVSLAGATPGVWIAPYDGTGIGLWFYDVYSVDFSFSFVEKYTSIPVKILASTVVADIDFNQSVRAGFGDSNSVLLRPPGSGLTFMGSGRIGDTNGAHYEGTSDIPRGSYMLAGIGNTINFNALGNRPGYDTIYNPGKEKIGDSFELGFFGNASRGEVFSYATPRKPKEPTETTDITIFYDRVAKIRPWAIRNSGSWKSFVTKDIHMARRTHDSWDKSSTEINVEQVGQVIPRDPRFGYVEPAGSGVVRGNYIRKDGNWKRQGKIGS
jgi:hypothetical protein